MRIGVKGVDVLALQADLNKAGFTTPSTGSFSAGTAATVKRFQDFYRLRADGVANAHTVAVLKTVDRLDAKATDAGVGGAGLGSGRVKVKVRVAHAKAKVTEDPTTLIKRSSVLVHVPVNGSSEHLGNRTLRPGMHGHDVRVLQAYLSLAGYPTLVDGQFGPTTKAHVVAWQTANALAANGVVTPPEAWKLRLDVAKVASTPRTSAPSSGASPSSAPASGAGPSSSAGPVETATLNADGSVTAPADAPAAIREMIAAANSIDTTPYIYGGGHASFVAPGYDCSGAVSFVLHAAGLLSSPEDSGQLESWGKPGASRWVSVYANAGHAFIVIAGLAFDTAHWGPTTPAGSGPRWLTPANRLANLNDGTGGYVARHPPGL